jgi:hypothetical protein
VKVENNYDGVCQYVGKNANGVGIVTSLYFYFELAGEIDFLFSS